MITTLSDSALDKKFATSYGSEKEMARSEIIERLTSVGSFVGGLFGFSRFPLYEKSEGAFNQVSAARGSTIESANATISSIKKAGEIVTDKFNLFGGVGVVLILVVVFAVIISKAK